MIIRDRKGFVLLIVMWTLALLTILTISFARRALYDNRVAAYSVDRTQCLHLARGAVQRGIAEIQNKQVIDFLQRKGNRTSFDQRWAQPRDLITDENIVRLSGPTETEGESCRYEIIDEERFISVNKASEGILDNIDAMSFRTVSDIMNRRATLSGKRDLAFVSREELRTLDGMDDDIWLGDKNDPGVRDLVTIWGDGKINLNTASREVLELVPDVSSSALEAFVMYRNGSDGVRGTADDKFFQSFSDIGPEAGIPPLQVSLLQRHCKLDSSFFTIRGIATQRQGQVRATVSATVHLTPDGAPVLTWREEIVGF